MQYWKSFFRMLGTNKRQYGVVTALSMLAAATEGFIHPLLIKAVLDEAASATNFSRFLTLVFGYFILGLTLNASLYLISLWQQKIDNRIVAKVSSDLMESYYRKSYEDIMRNGEGYYISRMRSDVKDGVIPMLASVRQIFSRTAMFLALLSALLIISWQAFLFLAAIIPIAAIISVSLSKKISAVTSVERDKEAELLSVLSRSISGFKIALSFGLVKKAKDNFDQSVERAVASSYDRFKVVRKLQGVSDLTMVVSDVCSIFVGALFVFRQQMTFGSFIAFMNAFWRSATTLVSIFKLWTDIQSYGTTLERVATFIDQEQGKHKYFVTKYLDAESISFSYNDLKIIQDFSLHLAPGSRALIDGGNGTGKTTLANLLAGFLRIDAGCLSRPGEVSAVTLPIAFPPLRLRDIVLDHALLEAFSVGTPSILEMSPSEMSAGQQQKIALCLALSKKSDLYILDEPLANLDPSSRRIAMDEIMRRTEGAILVVIMHGFDEYRDCFDVRLTMPEREVPMPNSADSEQSTPSVSRAL